MGIRDRMRPVRLVFGVDTETYSVPTQGLKSIQVHGMREEHYFTAEDWEASDHVIRMHICGKFFDWVDTLPCDSTLAFFNLKFDLSQMMWYLVHRSKWEYVEHDQRLRKGQFRVLESDTSVYKCEILTSSGSRIRMVDIGNFLTSTSLDKACAEWLGEHKDVLDSKDFSKRPASEAERHYAMRDAQLTYELYTSLSDAEVIEGRSVTIAGRTMSHFETWLRREYSMDFDTWAWGTKDPDLVEEYTDEAERLLRAGTRGGICQALHRGYYPNAHHIDARSMYPTQMHLDWIPTGPILHEKPQGPCFTIYFPKGFYRLKAGKVPYMQWKNKAQCVRYQWMTEADTGDYVPDFYLDGSYPIWDAELEILHECYECIEEDLTSKVWIRAAENIALKEYIAELYAGKRRNTGTKRQYYKILLNALYGKFLSRPDGIVISYAGGERHKVHEYERITYYLPLGMWIAMMGRVTLIKAMLSIPYDSVLYCDTDSMIYIGDIHPKVTIGDEMGDWSVENDGFGAWIVGPKTYQEMKLEYEGCNIHRVLLTKCAGLSQVILPTVPFGELEIGKEYKVLKARRDPETWAISLERTTYKVSDRFRSLRGMT